MVVDLSKMAAIRLGLRLVRLSLRAIACTVCQVHLLQYPVIVIVVFWHLSRRNKMTCASSEVSDQPGHPPSLIRVFAVRMKKHWALNYICNNDYGVNIGQVTSSRLCRRGTNLRILSGISGVSRNKQNEGKISILGSQKSKKVTKILHSHQ